MQACSMQTKVAQSILCCSEILLNTSALAAAKESKGAAWEVRVISTAAIAETIHGKTRLGAASPQLELPERFLDKNFEYHTAKDSRHWRGLPRCRQPTRNSILCNPRRCTYQLELQGRAVVHV